MVLIWFNNKFFFENVKKTRIEANKIWNFDWKPRVKKRVWNVTTDTFFFIENEIKNSDSNLAALACSVVNNESENVL